MSKNKLIEYLKDIFSVKELNFLDYETCNILLDLKEIKNTKLFLQECRKNAKKKIAGAHRISDWEIGWSGKGVYYSNDRYNNLPYYFKNNTHVRLKDRIYSDERGFAEVEFLRALQIIIFKKFINEYNCKTICEYGCGTGSNIEHLRNKISNLLFFGSDWADSACKKLIENHILKPENVFKVNYFETSTYESPNKKFVAYTNASLEQTGDNYVDFMNYLISNPNCIGGIHIEPIRELLDLSTESNKQSFDYSESRGYLKNFYMFVSNKKNIKILEAKDFGIGSTFINGYQVLCWKKN